MSAHPVVVGGEDRYANQSTNDIVNNNCSAEQIGQLNVRDPQFLSVDNFGETYLGFEALLGQRETLTGYTSGNICSNNYTEELRGIGASIDAARKTTTLACNPRDLSVFLGGVRLNINSDFTLSRDNVLQITNSNSCGQLEISYGCGR